MRCQSPRPLVEIVSTNSPQKPRSGGIREHEPARARRNKIRNETRIIYYDNGKESIDNGCDRTGRFIPF